MFWEWARSSGRCHRFDFSLCRASLLRGFRFRGQRKTCCQGRCRRNPPNSNPTEGEPAAKRFKNRSTDKLEAADELSTERGRSRTESGNTEIRKIFGSSGHASESGGALKKTMAPSNSEEPNKEMPFRFRPRAGRRDNETLKPSGARNRFFASVFRITIDGQLDDSPIAICARPDRQTVVVRGVGMGGWQTRTGE